MLLILTLSISQTMGKRFAGTAGARDRNIVNVVELTGSAVRLPFRMLCPRLKRYITHHEGRYRIMHVRLLLGSQGFQASLSSDTRKRGAREPVYAHLCISLYIPLVILPALWCHNTDSRRRELPVRERRMTPVSLLPDQVLSQGRARKHLHATQ